MLQHVFRTDETARFSAFFAYRTRHGHGHGSRVNAWMPPGAKLNTHRSTTSDPPRPETCCRRDRSRIDTGRLPSVGYPAPLDRRVGRATWRGDVSRRSFVTAGWISNKRFVDSVTLNEYTPDAYLETVFAGVTTPCDVEIESFNRDISRFTKRQPLEIERRECLQVLCSLWT